MLTASRLCGARKAAWRTEVTWLGSSSMVSRRGFIIGRRRHRREPQRPLRLERRGNERRSRVESRESKVAYGATSALRCGLGIVLVLVLLLFLGSCPGRRRTGTAPEGWRTPRRIRARRGRSFLRHSRDRGTARRASAALRHGSTNEELHLADKPTYLDF